MRCIFCKSNSLYSKSVEHIIPASLGNSDYVLDLGWVCDSCNNYFARKIESPFLNSTYGKLVRFEMRIPSKKGRIPVVQACIAKCKAMIDLSFGKEGLSFAVSNGYNEVEFIKDFKTLSREEIIMPSSGMPEISYDTSRFIAMLALEIFAFRVKEVKNANDVICDSLELDELRNYVRRGRPGVVWPIYMRRIYSPYKIFKSELYPEHQILNEFDILFIPSKESPEIGEYYVIIAILGIEYSINLGGPELDGYLDWLEQNDNISYLYREKNL